MSSWQVIQGDCLEVMKTLSDNSVDVILADPPYNNGTSYHNYDDRRSDYKEWCTAWFKECRRIAYQQVIIFPGHGNLWMWGEIEKPSGIGCWYKPGNPAHGGVFQFCEWEPWLLYGRSMGRSDVIRATVIKQRDVGDHPCPKPLTLLRELVNRVRGDFVLDPFMGSGTTGVACVQAKRNFIGIEIDADYCEIARKRIAEAAMQNVLL